MRVPILVLVVVLLGVERSAARTLGPHLLDHATAEPKGPVRAFSLPARTRTGAPPLP